MIDKEVARARNLACQRAWRIKHLEQERARNRGRLRAAASRGVVHHRLRVPNHLARWAARLRWAMPVSSNGSWRPDSVWDCVMLYADAEKLRARASFHERQLSTDAAAKFLRGAASSAPGP
jgi:hypothetical protein